LECGPHRREPIAEAAGGRIGVEQVAGVGDVGVRALTGQSVREPVDLAGGVVVDVLEPERFEPPRGSRAKVSEAVPAVDDHRARPIERVGAGAVELLEREVDRAGQMLLDVLVLREDLDEPGAVGEQPLHVLESDGGRHHDRILRLKESQSGYAAVMEPDRARQLLARERQRIEEAMAELRSETAADVDEPGDEGSETVYQREMDATRLEDLDEQLAAVERAEARLAAGTYGLSVESGEPIPDERLEAFPTAERTVEEEQQRG
jgi:DnaK suppressor protein